MPKCFLPTTKIAIIFATLLFSVSCSKSGFSAGSSGVSPGSDSAQATPPAVNPPDNPQSPPTDPCVPLAAQTRLTKIMFLVDASESNYGFFGLDGTDPKKQFRLGSIQNFFDRYNEKSNFQWGFMSFSGTASVDFIGGKNKHSFTTDVHAMQNALTRFSGVNDTGDTPYLSALDGVTSAVATDPDLNSKANPRYFVIFLSDGFPTDIIGSNDVQASIAKLLATDKSNVTLSTVFYGHKNESDANDAINLLTNMSVMGHGQFANATDPKSIINIDQLIPPPSNCPQ